MKEKWYEGVNEAKERRKTLYVDTTFDTTVLNFESNAAWGSWEDGASAEYPIELSERDRALFRVLSRFFYIYILYWMKPPLRKRWDMSKKKKKNKTNFEMVCLCWENSRNLGCSRSNTNCSIDFDISEGRFIENLNTTPQKKQRRDDLRG